MRKAKLEEASQLDMEVRDQIMEEFEQSQGAMRAALTREKEKQAKHLQDRLARRAGRQRARKAAELQAKLAASETEAAQKIKLEEDVAKRRMDARGKVVVAQTAKRHRTMMRVLSQAGMSQHSIRRDGSFVSGRGSSASLAQAAHAIRHMRSKSSVDSTGRLRRSLSRLGSSRAVHTGVGGPLPLAADVEQRLSKIETLLARISASRSQPQTHQGDIGSGDGSSSTSGGDATAAGYVDVKERTLTRAGAAAEAAPVLSHTEQKRLAYAQR